MRAILTSGAGKDFRKGRIATESWQAVFLCSEVVGVPAATEGFQVAPSLKMTQYCRQRSDKSLWNSPGHSVRVLKENGSQIVPTRLEHWTLSL